MSSPTSYVELSFVSRYEPSSIVIFLAVAKASLKVKVNFVIVPDVSDVAVWPNANGYVYTPLLNPPACGAGSAATAVTSSGILILNLPELIPLVIFV